MSERGFSVRLSASVDAYVAAMERARASTEKLTTSGSKSFEKLGGDMQRLGGWATTHVSLPIVAAGGAMIKASLDWESAWAGVRKTVDGTGAQLETLEKQLRGMATSMPATHGEIAAVAEAAGQLGVKTADIADFTEVMVKLGASTNLSADEAATSIAQMTNVMKTAPEDVDNLAAALVELGNNGASTERDIIQMSQRIAGAGKIVGLSEAEVLGFANALASVGVEVEAGGSSISTTMTKIASSVASGGEKLDMFARTAGMSTAQFRTAFETDAAGAIVTFVEGLGEVEASGGNVFGVLDALGLSDIRVSRALLSMAGAGDLLRDSLELGNKAWEEGTALEDEYGKRAETSAAKLRVLWNQIVDVAIDLGDKFVPILEEAVGGIAGLVRWFGDLPAPVQDVALGFIAVTAAAGPLLTVSGSLIKNFGLVSDTFSKMKGLAAANPFLGVTAGFAGLAGLLAIAPSLVKDTRVTQEEMAIVTGRVATALDSEIDGIISLAAEAGGAVNPVQMLAAAQEALSKALTAGADDQAEFTKALGALGFTSDETAGVFRTLSDVFDALDSGGTTEDFLRLNDAFIEMLKGKGIAEDVASVLASVATDMSISGDVTDHVADQTKGWTAENLALFEAMKLVGRQVESTDMTAIASDYLNAQVAAGGLNQELVAQAEAQAGASRNGADAVAVWDAYQQILSTLTPAQLEVLSGVKAAADGQKKLGQETSTTTELTEEQVAALERQKAALDRVKDALSDYRNEFELLADAAGVLDRALDQVTGGAGDMESAQRAFNAGLDDVAESVKENGRSLDLTTEKGRANREMIQSQLGTIQDYGVALVKNGASTEDAATAMDLLTESYVAQLVQAGFTEEAARAYIDTLKGTPEDVATALSLVHDEQVKAQLAERLDQLDQLDEGVAAEIKALIDEGSFGRAAARIRMLTGEVTVLVRGTTGKSAQSAEGRYVPAGANLLSTFGEKGPEAILPLDNASRLRVLLGDQRISKPIVDALAAGAPAGSAGGSAPAVADPWAEVQRMHSLDDWLPKTEPADAAAEGPDEATLMERRYKRGDLSAEDYDNYLAAQQTGLEKFSDAEEAINDKRMQLMADRRRAADDELQHERDLMRDRFEMGEISAEDYQAYLTGQLETTTKYSDDYMTIWGQIHGLQLDAQRAADQRLEDERQAEEDRTKAYLDRIADMYEQAANVKAANDAAQATDEAMGELDAAATKAALYHLDRNRSAEDRAQADAELEAAKQAAADALFRRADANANNAGADDKSVEWAAMVRAALEGDMANAPALAPYIEAVLQGVPKFGYGGYVPPTAGGALVRVAERGVGEYLTPAPLYDRTMALLDTVAMQYARSVDSYSSSSRGPVEPIVNVKSNLYIDGEQFTGRIRREIRADNNARALELRAAGR